LAHIWGLSLENAPETSLEGYNDIIRRV